jgi:hypothetical protein
MRRETDSAGPGGIPVAPGGLPPVLATAVTVRQRPAVRARVSAQPIPGSRFPAPGPCAAAPGSRPPGSDPRSSKGVPCS